MAGSSLPGGLTETTFASVTGGVTPSTPSTTYYVGGTTIGSAAGNTFKLYTNSDLSGTAVDITSAGSGTLTITALQADYISGLYNSGSNPLVMTDKNGVKPSVSVGNPLPRLAYGAISAQSVDPEDAACPSSPDNQFCTVVTWSGSTNSPSDPDTKMLSVLVVRDSSYEPYEEFRISLDNLKGNGVSYAAGANTSGNNGTGGTNQSLRVGGIYSDYPNTPLWNWIYCIQQ